MTPDRATELLAMIAVRDAQDSFERAVGWAVLVMHVEVAGSRTLYGSFAEPAAALAWAADFERGLNCEDEDGFRCLVLPIMPVPDA